jgi:gp16 family phage-associated protein
MSTKPSLKTPSEAKQWFVDRGISITDWAREHGFPRSVVYAALAGRTKGYRGEAHEVALALRLKSQPADSESAALDNKNDRPCKEEVV